MEEQKIKEEFLEVTNVSGMPDERSVIHKITRLGVQ